MSYEVLHGLKKELDCNKGLHHYIEDIVLKYPNKVAVSCGYETITYKELNEKANIVAWHLNSLGVKTNDVVAILMPRCIELIIGVLGIIKAGASYLPIDESYPEERISFILENSNTNILLINDVNIATVVQTPKEKNLFINISELIKNNNVKVKNPNFPFDPSARLYLIYTSGSTGRPKGAGIRIISFMNLMLWFTEEFEVNDNDNLLLFASLSFDLAQKNMFCTLMRGGKLVLYPEKTFNPRYI
ncbi:MAG: AMP-binding protein, partial [Oscillospiraceae bacterium]|nr:AMP-binding protein [Oscillospiraceae bacterium]